MSTDREFQKFVQRLNAEIRDRALATNTLFGLAGGVALVATGVFFFGERAREAAPKLKVAPGPAGRFRDVPWPMRSPAPSPWGLPDGGGILRFEPK